MARPRTRWIAMLLTALAAAFASFAMSGAHAATEPAATAQTLKIFPPPAGGIAWRGEPIRISLLVGGAEATNVRLVRSMLREAESFRTLDFQLCRQPAGACPPLASLDAGQAYDLYLRARGAVTPGNYAGTFVISSSQKPDGESVDMSLYVTSGWRLFLGSGAILIGVIVSWLVTVVARNRIGRKELERALALLKARIDSLGAAADQAFPPTLGIELPAFRQALSDVESGLTEAAARLPRSLPLPGQAQWPHGEWFQGEATRLDAALDGLEAIMARGLHPARRMLAAHPDDNNIKGAIASVDAKAAEAGTQPLAELIAAIKAILAAVPTPTPTPEALVAARAATDGATVVRKLDFEISMLGAASWWVILVTTVLVGMLVLLLPDKGFGKWEDYVVCLLWGFGLPVAGGQMTSLSTDSVRTAFSLTRPG